jgi:hypothetical protein
MSLYRGSNVSLNNQELLEKKILELLYYHIKKHDKYDEAPVGYENAATAVISLLKMNGLTL